MTDITTVGQRPGSLSRSVPAAPVVPRRPRLLPIGVDAARIRDGVWAERQRVNATATIPHALEWLERAGWLANFDRVAGGTPLTHRQGREFSDSEVYKWLEATAWELGRSGDHERGTTSTLGREFDLVAERVAAAQADDGYLNTRFGGRGQPERWSDLEWGHELYCLGHLFQAAVACHRTGKSDHLLVTVAVKAADHVCNVFGPGGNPGLCGHPEVEVALVELGRALDTQRYIDQAADFVDRRGHGRLADIEFGRKYYQDDEPVRSATVLRGHAVRANYLSAAAADIGDELADHELLDAVARQHRHALERRTYLTGGQGSHHQDEGFGEDWVLPPDRAYSETCAAIGSIMVAWRLLLSTGKAEYGDQIERALYNVVATSVADDGRAFFYANPLHQRVAGAVADQEEQSRRASSFLRAPWFDVSCCPTNIARTFASLSALTATVDAGGVQIHQYADMELDTALPGVEADKGGTVALSVRTAYPDDGRIAVTVKEAPHDGWRLTLRVPAWATSAQLTSPGGQRQVEPGWVHVDGLSVGETVVLLLDMTPQLLRPHPHVDAVRGCVAVRRGPEIYALESVDVVASGTSADLSELRILIDRGIHERDGSLFVNLIRVPEPQTLDGAVLPQGGDATAPPDSPAHFVTLVRYRDWASRGPSTMRIWIPTAAGAASIVEAP